MIGILGLIIIGAVILTLLISGIYLGIYQHTINKQLQTDVKTKKMPAPLTVCILTFILLLLAGLALIAILGLTYYMIPSTAYYGPGTTTINQASSFDSTWYTPEDISGTYAALYEGKNQLPGYTKYEKTDGDFSYTYYISNEEYDILHPKCIVFLEYTGEDDYDLYECYSGFSDQGFSNYEGSNSEGPVPEYLCFLANANGNCSFDIGIAAYKQAEYESIQETLENDESIDIVSGAVSLAKVSSQIHIPLDYYGDGKNTDENDYGVEDISFDGISLENDIDDVDLSRYTESDRYSGNYKYKFDNLIIDTNEDGIINYLYAGADEDVEISIGDKTGFTTIEDVTKLLGDDYEINTYDSEQMLNSLTYFGPYGMTATFVYLEFGDSTSSNNHRLCFVEMEME